MKKNKDLLKISKIERQCEISKDSLRKAINREQSSFKESHKLVPIFIRLCCT